MSIRCPDCRGILTIEGTKGRCAFHAGEYDILYARPQILAANPPIMPPSALETSETQNNLLVPPANPKIRCAFHTNTEAKHRCQRCNIPICETCTFTFSNQVYLCPDCVSQAPKGLTTKRKNLTIWSWILAVWTTIWFFVMFIGFAFVSSKDIEVYSQFMGLMTVMPSLVGVALGCGALDKRLSNPAYVKIPIVWNGILLGILLFLCFIGLMS